MTSQNDQQSTERFDDPELGSGARDTGTDTPEPGGGDRPVGTVDEDANPPMSDPTPTAAPASHLRRTRAARSRHMKDGNKARASNARGAPG
jgi:hypothetical protein